MVVVWPTVTRYKSDVPANCSTPILPTFPVDGSGSSGGGVGKVLQAWLPLLNGGVYLGADLYTQLT